MRPLHLCLALAFALILAACQPVPTPEAGRPAETAAQATAGIQASPLPDQAIEEPGLTGTPLVQPQEIDQALGYTYQRADGNRLVEGQGSMPDAAVIDIELGGVPRWVVSVPSGEGTLWAVTLAGGRTRAYQIEGGLATEVPVGPANLGESPPLLRPVGDRAELLASPAANASASHPVLLNGGELVAYNLADGRLVLKDAAGLEQAILEVQALPDGRLMTDELDRLLFLSEPTERYGHGVLGDDLEAASVTLVETVPEAAVSVRISIAAPQVIEGIMPLWVDIDGDGLREIIITLSDAGEGAQIVAYREDGQVAGRGPAIGRGFRWRHQIAVGPFGPRGETELVDVLTPHIGGVVEFYRLEGDPWPIVARVPGYTSHVIGTRNLDMALAGDFNGDGRPEIVLPNQDRTELGGIQRTEEGAEVAWRMPVDGRVSTNLSAARRLDGLLVLGIGREDGVLRIWQPDANPEAMANDDLLDGPG